MIDLHCHILPGIDDGAKSMDDSLKMARKAVAQGITHVLATPHYKNGRWDIEKEDILEYVVSLQTELDQREIPLKIFPGQEVRIVGELLEDISANKIQFIDEADRYILIEFPTATIPHFTNRLFFELQKMGITPIIVHPERNHAVLNNPDELLALVEKGALAQVTAGSYVGSFGKKIQKLSHQLIQADLVHFIASDAHNVNSRDFYMSEAFEKLGKEFGNQKVNQFQQITKDLINGEIIVTNPPKKVKKPKFLGIF